MFFRNILITSLSATAIVVLFSHPTSALESSVVINELMWMGSSGSSADEWLELRNTTDQAIDISGWQLTKKSSGNEVPMATVPPSASIAPHGYYVISHYAETNVASVLLNKPDLVSTGVTLVNSALQIKLYDSGHVLIDAADDGAGNPLAGLYDGAQKTYASMERNMEPGDGSLPASWHTATCGIGFKEGKTEKGTPGAANSNGQPQAEAGLELAGIAGQPVSFDGSGSSDPDGQSLSFIWDFGDGKTGSGAAVAHAYDVAGTYTATLTVNDGADSSSDTVKVVIAAAPEKKAEAPLVSNINTQDTSPTSGSVPTPMSITNKPTAAKKTTNTNTSKKTKTTTTKKSSNTNSATKKKTATKKKSTNSAKIVVNILIADLQERDSGDRVHAHGTITAPIDALGKNITYIQEGDAAAAVQFSGQPPKISVGQVLEATGTVRTTDGRRRIVIGANDPVTLADAEQSVEPQSLGTGDVTNELVDRLVHISGTVATVSGTRIEVDDGSGVVDVSIKSSTGIVRPKVKMGDKAEVTGIVNVTTAGIRILPRTQDDLKIEQVLGVATTTSTSTAPVAPQQQSFWYWALVGLGGIAAGAKPAWKWWKNRSHGKTGL